MIHNKNKLVVELGWFTVSSGGEQPGFTGMAKAETTEPIVGRLNVTGKVHEKN